LGYKVNDAILDAADYGVPQRRKRLILVAGRGAKIPFGPPESPRPSVKAAFAKLGRLAKTDPLHNLPENRAGKVKKLIREIPHDGGSRLDLGKKRQLKCHLKCNGFKDVYGRMAWHDVSPTITGGCYNPSKGRFLHPTKNRAITLREASLLQSFPAGYIFSMKGGKCSLAQMIGNALPPEFIRRHARMILERIEGR
jgi:DNA (cytosine-5)-methyltransferase 1